MGPRPPRLGTAHGSFTSATTSRPVEVVKLRSRHVPAPNTVPLPPVVLTALAAIARDMRDVPRDCIVDRMELLHWLRRLAGRVDGVAALRVVLAPPRPRRAPAGKSGATSAASARDAAEAVFAKASVRTETRAIVSRKGRSVRVEVRRATASGQMDLGF